MKKTFGLLAALSLMMICNSAPCQTIIYQHDFNGSDSEPLYGLSPDIDNSGLGATWVTRTDTGLPGGVGREWYADGHIDTTLELNINGAASLPFEPVAGKKYTLSVRINDVFTVGGDSFSWLGMGYASGHGTGAGGCAEFFCDSFPDQVTGQPWMMHRADTSVHANITALGPGVSGLAGWPTQFVAGGDPVDLRIVLDTTTTLWSAEWLAKAPTDAAYTSIRTDAYATNPTIRSVALGGNFNVGGRVDNFSLTVVPEPGSLLLAGTGLLAMALGTRRRMGK
jgi:hypothetical protein